MSTDSPVETRSAGSAAGATLDAPRPALAAKATDLTQIERVLSLQGVLLFRSCQTEEIVRLAAISSLVEVAPGDEVYAAGAPAMALYCVVEGEIAVLAADGSHRLVQERALFGVLEILSGRLRQRTARATRPTLLLSIAAEDFFDLLSNNVEIAKALFREILSMSEIEEAVRRLEGAVT